MDENKVTEDSQPPFDPEDFELVKQNISNYKITIEEMEEELNKNHPVCVATIYTELGRHLLGEAQILMDKYALELVGKMTEGTPLEGVFQEIIRQRKIQRDAPNN